MVALLVSKFVLEEPKAVVMLLVLPTPLAFKLVLRT
jgi:hypothetical protein